jgi:hypothetical protein
LGSAGGPGFGASASAAIEKLAASSAAQEKVITIRAIRPPFCEPRGGTPSIKENFALL